MSRRSGVAGGRPADIIRLSGSTPSSLKARSPVPKGSILGSFHEVSKKNLGRYLPECKFRFMNRKNPHLFRDTLKEVLPSDNVEHKRLRA